MNQPLGLMVALLTAVPLSACSAQTISYPDYAMPRLEGITVPGLPAVTGRIVVDPFGYLPMGDKVAIITNPVRGYNAGDKYRPGPQRQVRKAPGGDSVVRGAPLPWNDGAGHADAGDQGGWLDFSSRLAAMAAVHLFALPGKPEDNAGIVRLAPKTPPLSEGFWSPSEAGRTEARTDSLSLPGADAHLGARIRTPLRPSAQSARVAPPAQADLCRAGMNPVAAPWGSNPVRASLGFAAWLAAQYGGLSWPEPRRLRQRAPARLPSFPGVNPLSAVRRSPLGGRGAALSRQPRFHAR